MRIVCMPWQQKEMAIMSTYLTANQVKASIKALHNLAGKRDATALQIALAVVYHVSKGNPSPLIHAYAAQTDAKDNFPRGFWKALKYQFTEPGSNSGESWVKIRKVPQKKLDEIAAVRPVTVEDRFKASIPACTQREFRIDFDNPPDSLADLMPPEEEREAKPISVLKRLEKLGEDVLEKTVDDIPATGNIRQQFRADVEKLVAHYRALASRSPKTAETVVKPKRKAVRKVAKAVKVTPMTEEQAA